MQSFIARQDAEAFMAKHGSSISDRTVAAVEAYEANRNRSLKPVVGTAVVGLFAAQMFLTASITIGVELLVIGLVAYLAGLMWIEVHDVRIRRRTQASAPLEHRTLQQFARTPTHLPLYALTVVIVATCVMQMVWGDNGFFLATAYCGASVLVLAVVEVTQRAIAQRRRSETDADLLAADDAIRIAGVASVRTTGLALNALILAYEYSNVAGDLKGLWLPLLGGSLGLIAAGIVLTLAVRKPAWPELRSS
jgi:uncharacterized membrane protein